MSQTLPTDDSACRWSGPQSNHGEPTAFTGSSSLVPAGLPGAFVLLLLVVTAAAVQLLPPLQEVLILTRDGLEHGQAWRLLTGHWVHFTWSHWLWSVCGFVIPWVVCLRFVGLRRTLLCVGISSVIISWAVYLLQPELTAYSGLSGIDCALYAMLMTAVARRAWIRRDWLGAAAAGAALAAITAKIIYEFSGQAVFAPSTRFVPVPLAHIAGAVVGMLVAATAGRAGAEISRHFAGSSSGSQPGPAAAHRELFEEKNNEAEGPEMYEGRGRR